MTIDPEYERGRQDASEGWSLYDGMSESYTRGWLDFHGMNYNPFEEQPTMPEDVRP